LKSQEIAHPKEWIELSTLMEQVSLDPKILLSDFDGDGIRDFTLSTSGAQLVLSAEDDDWDNDGTPNLIDKDWGNHKFEIDKVTAKTITNKFDVRGVEASDLLKSLDEMNINLIPDRELKHDLLLLNVIHNTLKYAGIEKGKLRFIRLSKAKVQYGKKVYFAFNPASLTIDIYQEALLKHFNEVHSKYYSKSSVEDVLKGYLLPLLYHSLAHELVHAMDLPVREMAKNDGWTFNLQNTGSKYLKNNRLDRKKISELMNNTRYKAHTPDEWVALYRKAGKGFLVKKGLPSFYALQKPSEWVAEKVSMCFLRRVFPNSVTAKGSAGYEALLGVNPSSVTKEFCSNYFANLK
ncbi:MAG: hypothetical protein KC478_10165, partial [Bacteriovoracaceae bacterium]|nr:hypothetical protein [Bacteriovoracaceae bacterium]